MGAGRARAGRKAAGLLHPSVAGLEVLGGDRSDASKKGMAIYGRACAWTLARAHARSGDRIAIAAYLGRSDAFDRAIADFAEAYADQNERDYRALVEAVKVGRVRAESEV